MKNIYKHLILIVLIILSAIFSGCHKDYINITNEFGRHNTFNKSKTEIAFYKFIHISRPPKSFGTQKTIFRKTALFTYNLKTKELKEIFCYEGLPYGRDAVKQDISYQNNIIAFSLHPISNWKYKKNIEEKFSGIYLFYKDTENISRLNIDGRSPKLSPDERHISYLISDSVSTYIFVKSLKNNEQAIKIITDTLNTYKNYFWKSDNELILVNDTNIKMIEIPSLKISEADSSDILNSDKITNKELTELTKDFTYKEWGIDINKHVPKSKKARINDITNAYGSSSYRMAVFQEIEESLTNKEIEMMSDELAELKENLSQYEKQRTDHIINVLITKLNDLSARRKKEQLN